ncbi:MAG: MarR family winged helix-turn-helix transcriptional regulator [Candidatus Gallimonas sp.]
METARMLLCAGRELARLMDDNLRRKGLSHAQIHVLGFLDENLKRGVRCNQREISRACGNTRAPSVTKLLQSLERRGLIARETGSDARVRYVSLTAEGKRLARECRAFMDRVEERIRAGFSEEQLEAFCRALGLAAKNLGEFAEEIKD